MANTRALKLKAGSEERDQKLTDLRRLKNGLTAFLADHFSDVRTHSKWKRRLPDGVQITLAFESKVIGQERHDKVEFKVHHNGVLIRPDSADLTIIRTLHENMDDMIGLVEEVCEAKGLDSAFATYLSTYSE